MELLGNWLYKHLEILNLVFFLTIKKVCIKNFKNVLISAHIPMFFFL